MPRGPKGERASSMIRIAITEKAYAALVASVDEKPEGTPQADPSGKLYVFLDQTTVARLEEIGKIFDQMTIARLEEFAKIFHQTTVRPWLEEIAKIYARDMSRTILRLAELRNSWGVSMLQELMSDVDDLNDPPEWKRMVQSAEERERDFRAFIAACLTERGRYEKWGLDPAQDLVAVIDQALVTPGRAYLEELRRKSKSIRKGWLRPKRRSFK